MPPITTVTKRNDALLLALEAMSALDEVVPRPALERLVFAAGDAGVLEVFRAGWRRGMYEALADLEQAGFITLSTEGYRLTEHGFAAAQAVPCPAEVLEAVRTSLAAMARGEWEKAAG